MSDITDDTALGGSFGNVGDSQVQTFNNAAAASASEAAISATNASDSATASANSATASASSAGTSASEATAAAASAAAALVSKNNAATSETNAETAETNAETAETNAGTSATASASSATSASSSATSATSSASGATTSATNAATSATNSGNSATASASSATGAATSATNASNSSGTAATSATNAGNSATAAATSATNSSNSATAASSSASTATTKASEASTSASNASTSASTATTKAGEASTSATNSATSATAAGVARTGAEAARDAALAAFDNFDDKYLGEKSSDPTTDNDGDPLAAGMLYYNTTDNIMKVYTGSSWVAAYASLTGALLVVNNLSDLDDVVPARTNLGLGTAATTAATAYATAAQGTKADAALPKAGGAMSGAITTNSTFDGRDVATDGTKLDGIETNADVTDTANVTSSGALMDSEVTNLAQVKAFDSTDYATASQGATANAALPKAGGAMTGAITTNSTFDGVDVGTRDAVLTSTTTTANAALPKAGGTMTGPLVVNETTAVTMSAGTTGQRPTGVAGMFRYNTTEDKFEGYSTAWGEIGGGAADLKVNSFTGDGSTVAYTLTTSPVLDNTLAYIDGVYQVKAAYSMSGQVLTFTAAPDSGALIEITAATVAPVQESTDFLLNNFTGNGSTTAFTLSSTPTSENQTSVYLSGVYQNKDSYSVSGTTLTFGVAPPNAVGIEVMCARTVFVSVGTPDNNTVSTAKIVDGAVTSAKLAAGAGGAFNDFAIKTTAYTAVTRDQLIVNSGSAVTITLPASPAAGNVVFIKNAGAGTVTVARNGSNINSTADNGSLITDAAATLVYVDSTIGWKEL